MNGRGRMPVITRIHYFLGTALPYTSNEATREVDGIHPPAIRSLKPTSSTRVRSGVAFDVGMIGTRFGSGCRRLLAFVGESVISRLRQCRSPNTYSRSIHEL